MLPNKCMLEVNLECKKNNKSDRICTFLLTTCMLLLAHVSDGGLLWSAPIRGHLRSGCKGENLKLVSLEKIGTKLGLWMKFGNMHMLIRSNVTNQDSDQRSSVVNLRTNY